MSGIGHVDGARRVLVYGVTGSGKSALARELSEISGIPWTDVDAHAWRPGWTPVPDAEQRETFTAICDAESWILDTAYHHWRDVTLDRTELVVALDYPRLLSLTRLVRRTAVRVLTRRRVCNGNVETLGRALSRDSILRWHVVSFPRKRATIAAWADDPDGPRMVRLRSRRSTAAWLAGVRAGGAGPH